MRDAKERCQRGSTRFFLQRHPRTALFPQGCPYVLHLLAFSSLHVESVMEIVESALVALSIKKRVHLQDFAGRR
jgi:hypothetical protein